MRDAGRRYLQQTGIARQPTGGAERSAAVEAWTAAIETTSNDPGLRQEHVAALLRLGSLKRELGQAADAERLFTQAVAIGEKYLGAEHPQLKVALNELSRLYVRQSNHVRAEPVLQRLLEITRANGDKDPDVATVLAGLAVAKRGLGDIAEAEQLYRQALRIREEVLPSNHMAIVVTLEQLAETCAARGSHAEALVHLQRALIRRESALGAEHATVVALRERIADVEQRHAESAKTAMLTPALPIVAIDAQPVKNLLPVAVEPTPESAAPTRTTRESRATPIRLRSVASAPPKPVRPGELAFLYKPQPASTQALPTRGAMPMTSPATVAAPADRPARALTSSVAVADAPTISGASLFDISTAVSSRMRTVRHASIGAAVVVLAVSGIIFGERKTTDGEHTSDPVATKAPSTLAREVSTAGTPAVVNAASVVSAVSSHSAPSASTNAVEAKPSGPTAQPTSASATPSTTTSASVALPNLRKLTIPKVATPNLDSVMQASAKLGHDADANAMRAGEILGPSSAPEVASVIPPVLIGTPPTPRFPDELRARPIEGEVIVQFRVNEKGRVEPSSMQVLQSQHELFTAAVRNVLSQFRFEPARSGNDSKPQAAWVQFRTRFDARR